jgi:hypothetical protein
MSPQGYIVRYWIVNRSVLVNLLVTFASVVTGSVMTRLVMMTRSAPMAYLRQWSRPTAVVLAALGLLAVAPGVLAQSTDPAQQQRVNAAEGFGSADTSGGVFGESSSPFDLIHRAVLMNERSRDDFSRQHQGRINSAANDFRTQQQEALRRQSQPAAEEAIAPSGEL